jgi:hypothetical protein
MLLYSRSCLTCWCVLTASRQSISTLPRCNMLPLSKLAHESKHSYGQNKQIIAIYGIQSGNTTHQNSQTFGAQRRQPAAPPWPPHLAGTCATVGAATALAVDVCHALPLCARGQRRRRSLGRRRLPRLAAAHTWPAVVAPTWPPTSAALCRRCAHGQRRHRRLGRRRLPLCQRAHGQRQRHRLGRRHLPRPVAVRIWPAAAPQPWPPTPPTSAAPGRRMRAAATADIATRRRVLN